MTTIITSQAGERTRNPYPEGSFAAIQYIHWQNAGAAAARTFVEESDAAMVRHLRSTNEQCVLDAAERFLYDFTRAVEETHPEGSKAAPDGQEAKRTDHPRLAKP